MLTPRWRKVVRDLYRNKTKTILVVLAMAVGLFAFGSVFITDDVLVADMNNQYHTVNTSNIIISIPSFDTDLVQWASRQPEVSQAQGQASYMVKLIVGDKSYNLSLYAYSNYSLIGMNRVTPEKGTWPPGRHEVTFERASIQLSQANIGDKVLIELSSGKRYELAVAGTVHDLNAMPATMFPLPTGYVTLETLEWLGFPGNCNQLNIVARSDYKTIPELEKAAYDIKKRLLDMGYKVDSIQVRKVDDHWAKEVTQSFTLILSAVGIFSLMLSAFLVINTITALLAQQRRQIGVMKAVGGTGRQIIGLYLVLVTFYGVLALFVALPISMGLGYYFISLVANLLNIDIIGFHLPMRVFILELVAALVIPVISASLPILGGVRITVRETLSNYGISGKSKADLFDRLLMHVTILSRPLLLSLRNTFRRKARLALTMGTLIIAGTLFIGVMNVRASLTSDLEAIFKKYYDFEVSLNLDGSYPGKGVETRVMRTPGVTQVEGWASAGVQRIKSDGTKGTSFSILGVPPTTKFMQPDITQGRWLVEKDRNAVVLSSALLKDMTDVKVGDKVVLELNNEKYEFELVGIIPLVYDRIGYASFDYLTRIKGESDLASSLYVKTEQKDGTAQAKMAETLETQLKKSGVKVASSMTRDTIASSLTSRNEFLVYFLLIMAIMAAVIGGLALMGMMSLNVLERTREIGVMRSIGASSGTVGGIVVAEGLLIGFISWLIAIPISIPMSMFFDTMLGTILGDKPLDFVFSPQGLIIWLVIVTAISVVASLLPASRAMSMSVRETLAYE